jgi:alpha-tubulin suppressor-like RCC1 family protein
MRRLLSVVFASLAAFLAVAAFGAPASAGLPRLLGLTETRIQSVNQNAPTAFPLNSLFDESEVFAMATWGEFRLDPSEVFGGQVITGTVELYSPAPSGGTLVGISYPFPASNHVVGPNSVTVPAGQTSVSFPINTKVVNFNQTITINAALGGDTASDTCLLKPMEISDLTVTSPVGAGQNMVITAKIGIAVSSEVLVSVNYNNRDNFVTYVGGIRIPAGSLSGSVSLRSNPAIEGGFSGTIQAYANSSSAGITKPYTVLPTVYRGAFVYPYVSVPGQRGFRVQRLANPRATDSTVGFAFIPAGQTYGVEPFTTPVSPTPPALTRLQMATSFANEGRLEDYLIRPASNAFAAGLNSYFAVGDGLTRHREAFCPITFDGRVLQAVVAGNTLLVLKSDGSVWSIGQGNLGQHGDGTSGVSAVRNIYTRIAGLPPVRFLAANGPSILAIDESSQVWAWGQNNLGQCGQAPSASVNVPTRITALADIVTVAASSFAGFAIDGAGRLWSWGGNSRGASGQPTTSPTPRLMPGAPGPFVALGAGIQHAFAIHADGGLFGWGLNSDGQLGDGTFTDKLTATRIPGITHVRQVQAGLSHSILLRTPPYAAYDEVRTTGNNFNGQRGDGSLIGSASRSEWRNIAGSPTLVQVGAGLRSGFYVNSSSLYSWGAGAYGERGDGSFTAATNTPRFIQSSVSAVFAGGGNTLLLKGGPENRRHEVLLANPATRAVQSMDFRTGALTPIVNKTPNGFRVVGGGELAGSPATSEIVSLSPTNALWYQEVNNNTIGSAVALRITLASTEVPFFFAQMDNEGRDDLVSVNWSNRRVLAHRFNGAVETGVYNLYTLAATETLAGVGDFNLDGNNDILIFNTSTRQFTVKLLSLGTTIGTSPLLASPSTPFVPGPLPALDPALTPLTAGEAKSPFDVELLFSRSNGTIEMWNMSRLNRGQTGIPTPALPAGFSFAGFWR